MKRFLTGIAGLLGALTIFLIAPSISNAAFGISPPFLNADHLVPGAVYSQTIFLVQDQPNTDLTIKADLELPEVLKQWVTIDHGTSFVIPQGVRQFPVVVSVRIPKDAKLAKYNGNITFSTVPNQAGQVTISIGASLAVNLTVGNDIFEKFSVPLLTFSDIEEGWNPRVVVKFANDGNIPEAFDSATFDLYDHFDSVRLAYVTKQDGFPETPPFTTKEYVVEFPVDFHLGTGDYWGVVNFYQNQKLIASQKTIFHVLKTGTLTGTFGIVMKFVKDYAIAFIAGAVVLVGLILFGFSRVRRKRRARIA